MATTSTQSPPEPANQPTASPWRRPGVILAGASILALAVVGIVWAANDDDSGPSTAVTDSRDTEAQEAPPAPADSDAIDGILRAISKAQNTGSGVPVSVERNGSSWLVELEEVNGTETTVQVEGDTATVTESERDNEAGQTNGLNRANVEAASMAALAEHDGTVVAISADDDSINDAYSVDVQTAGTSEIVEVELDSDFKVTHTETEGMDN